MKDHIKSIGIFLIGLAIVAAAALIPPLSPPCIGGTFQTVDSQTDFSGEIGVIVQGDGVAKAGMYRVPFDCTYGELFDLTGVDESLTEHYDRDEQVRFTDAVLIEGEYCIYLIF